jgi:hypothetical protein
MSLVYGNPLGRVGQTTASGAADTSAFQKLLGTAAVGAGVYKNLGSPNLNFLNPFSSFSSPSNMGTIDANYPALGSNWWD